MRRRLHAEGRRPLRSLVSSFELRRRLRWLILEGVTERSIACRLGLRDPRVSRGAAQVTFRKVLQLRWVCRQLLMDEDQEAQAS